MENPWKKEDFIFLKNHREMNSDKIAKILNKDLQDVIKARDNFDLYQTSKKGYKVTHFTQEELDFIKNNPHLSNKEIGNALNRSPAGIRLKRIENGLKYIPIDKVKKTQYTEKEILFFQQNRDKTDLEMSVILNRSTESIRRKRKDLNLSYTITLPEGKKICSRCKEVLDFSEFNKNRSKKDKLDSYCKHCKKIYFKERQIKKLNLEIRKKEKETENNMYVCSKCKKNKLGKEFYFNKKRAKRMTSKCIECSKKEAINSMNNNIKNGGDW